MAQNDKQVDKKTSESTSKTPYNRPQLVIYGDIREITLTKQAAKSADNPGMDNNMSVFG